MSQFPAQPASARKKPAATPVSNAFCSLMITPCCRSNALVQLQAHYHHCGEAASEKCLSAATFVRRRLRSRFEELMSSKSCAASDVGTPVKVASQKLVFQDTPSCELVMVGSRLWIQHNNTGRTDQVSLPFSISGAEQKLERDLELLLV